MPEQQTSRSGGVERLMAGLPGLLLILAGVGLVGIAVLTPQWQANGRVGWERRVMEAQAETLVRQRVRYEQFLEGLERDDPVLLERLAYAQLRKKPAGMAVLTPGGEIGGGMEAGSLGELAEAGAVEAWLNEEPPRVGRELRAFEAVDTPLTRLATGKHRLLVVVLGVACVGIGLLPSRPSVR
ncbi:MAG: hypothetical protein AAF750_12080 [Planctomycetota bacterium]